jgi:hypothetical protein
VKYTPLGPEPGTCSAPGHGDRAARQYPGGWLCGECAEVAARARKGAAGARPVVKAEVRLAIVGTRVLACPGDLDRVRARVAVAIRRLQPAVVISGGADGVDKAGQDVAEGMGYSEAAGTLIVFRPRAGRFHGPGGYRERDEQIAQACTHLLRAGCQAAVTYGSGWTADRAEQLGKVVVRWQPCPGMLGTRERREEENDEHDQHHRQSGS